MNKHRLVCAIAVAAAAILAGHALAQGRGCFLNGTVYPAGSRLGGLTCINGAWR